MIDGQKASTQTWSLPTLSNISNHYTPNISKKWRAYTSSSTIGITSLPALRDQPYSYTLSP